MISTASAARIRPMMEKRMRIMSEENRLAVDAETLLEGRHDLSLGDVGLDAVEQGRHQVVAAAGGLLQLVEAVADAGVVTARFERGEPRHLAAFGFRSDLQRRDGGALTVLVGVDPDDDPLVGLQLALEVEGRIGDFALEEAVLDAAQYATLLVDP